MQTAKWPKILPPLSPEHKRISDAFMQQWHVELAGRSRYGALERFNHNFPVKHSRPGFKTTLEIGAGLGEHLHYETLTPEQETGYYANEFRENMAAEIRRKYPRVNTVLGDCQQRFDFADGFFDRFIAVHVMEHLPNLPATIREAYRLLNKERGQLLIVIPCEGAPAYSLARKISAQHMFEKTYGISYDIFIKREHLNVPAEILAELDPYFTIEKKSFFPLPFLPFVFNNLIIGLSLVPRLKPLV
ncbi:MAG: class I SAM-dependent methyltransferase [Undibacterium sp.]|nr:class I SAM-dependent methyltransferase [Opitutaceae bacterium]